MEIAFNETGDLFVVNGGVDKEFIPDAGTIYTFKPSAKNPPIATIFGSGVPGARHRLR